MGTNEEISEINQSLSEIEMRQIHLVNGYAVLVNCYKELSASYKETVDTIKEIAGLSNETTKSLGLIANVLKEMADDKLKSAEPITQCKDCLGFILSACHCKYFDASRSGDDFCSSAMNKYGKENT